MLTVVKGKHTEWRAAMVEAWQHAQDQGPEWQIEVELYAAILARLDGQSPALPAGHPYVETLAQIQAGVESAS